MARYGSKGKVSKKQMRETIMKANKWTKDEYRRKYDIFKNKLRAYESYQEAHGKEVKPQSPQVLLYKQARAKMRQGTSYEPSAEMKRIQSFSAVSISKGRKLARDYSSVYSQRRAKSYAKATTSAFAGLIDKVEMAKRIDESIDDPVLKEQALAELAKHIHAKQTKGGAFTGGETYGSDSAGSDFDIDNWLYF